jgi:nucleotide-binding universal stress UspA family protein
MVLASRLLQVPRMESTPAALDFSAVAASVLARTSEMAERFHARLWLIHAAASEPAFVGYEPGPQSVRDQRAAELRERGLDATALRIEGPPAEKILEEASRLGVGMIVMGSHGRTGRAPSCWET